MSKKSMILVIAGIMLFSFSVAPSAQAFVPAAAFIVVGLGAAAAGTAAYMNETKKQEEQQESNLQQQKQDHEIKYVTLEFQEGSG
jgi:predicted ribosomally synthesized peptide with SipW-like signal peptide